MSQDAVRQFVKGNQVIGLGSGSMAAAVVREIAKLKNKDTLECIPTSLQIKVEAENGGLHFTDESRIPDIDVMFDGADQIDSKFHMIKGGGGALLREKILILAAKKVVIVADESKFVRTFSRPVPVEVHPVARTFVAKKLKEYGGQPALRTLDSKGYPFITENGNVILDTTFATISDPRRMEMELQSIPGVLEVGLFTKKADVYYKAKNDGTFEVLRP
jgi:ribose 5-phosphate isomerase A